MSLNIKTVQPKSLLDNKFISSILYFFYDVFFLLGFCIYLPVYFWRKKITFQSLKEKIGILRGQVLGESIWIQVVSVGEVNIIASLIERLQEIYKGKIVISTTTLTGNRLAREKYSKVAKVIFLPLDVSFIIKKVINFINPKLFIAVETEIWPALFKRLKQKNVPIIIINGRISDKAFSRYKLITKLMKRIVDKCDYIGVQNQEYKNRFLSLGASQEQIRITGNLKFESISIDHDKLALIKEKYSSILKDPLKSFFIAASTHHPEEEKILSIFSQIHQENPQLSLLIAPRHPQRVGSIEKTVLAYGFEPVRLSEASKYQAPPEGKNVYLVDTIGELFYIFSLCDICFVGGSLSDNGGHNVLEPIYFLKPTIFGPNMHNFLDIEEKVLKEKAAIKVSSSEELKDVLIKLLENKSLCHDLRNNCMQVFENQKRAFDLNLEVIIKYI